MSRQREQLDAYRAKRVPSLTPEPFGGRRPDGSRLFVVQKHAARRLHYDLRLEMDGVLKSWAVPKGPSVRPREKRLAVHVEDHPVDYADFEGLIPAGNYGAGAVIVWDRGWYQLVKPEDPLRQLERGKLEVELFGLKLRGKWTLVRMSGKDKEWLLLKTADAFGADEELTDRWPESILSGLTVEELRDGSGSLGVLRRRLETLTAPARDVPLRDQALMLASPSERPFSKKGWLFEIKYDGVRVLASRDGEAVTLVGRSGQVITTRYPEVARALQALPVQRFIFDGEIVALDEGGRPSFQRLQARMHLTRLRDIEPVRATVPVTGVFFDCLALDGRDLRGLPLLERKECLRLLLPGRGVIRYGDHVLEQGLAFYDAASSLGLEGIVAKKVSSRYVDGRSRDWIKLKCQRRQEFVIGGYTDPQGSRRYFGALHLGVYEGSRLVYVSKVGTGFDAKTLRMVWEKLRVLPRSTSPFDAGGPSGRGHHWVEPRLVCEVRFTEWTDDGGIRHPAFLGLRDDKPPEECRRERPEERVAPASAEPEGKVGVVPRRARTGAKHSGVSRLEASRRGNHSPEANHPEVKVTNPNKVFWPEEGYTKADLIAYYNTVAPFLLRYLKDRPLVLTRYPDGITGKSFFQKDAPDFIPGWIRTERIYSKDAERDIDYFIVNDPETLRYVVNLGTIPLHLWSSRVQALDRPDWLVLDLDPKGAPFTDVVKVARGLRELLERLELPSYVKTSGATGLHVLVPLGARYTHEEARNFGAILASLAVEAQPEISTVARPIRARGGKVYVDFGQNGHGRTIAAPLSVRPLPAAPVSCPLRWDEVTQKLDPKRFTIKTAPARFEKTGDPLAKVLQGGIDMATALARIQRQFRSEGSRLSK